MRLTAVVLSLVMVAGSGAALAGAGKGHGGMAHMQEALDLTDEQVAEMRRIRESGGTREEMNAVLTEEQRAKAAEMRSAHGKRAGKKGSKEDRLARMQQHLDLTDEQVVQIREIRENGGSREDVHAVLTDDQRNQLEQMRQRHGGKGRHGE